MLRFTLLLVLLAADAAAGDYTFVFLRAPADAPELSEDELATAMAGHFQNMGRLAEEGKLLVAGPLGPPRVDPAHRGVFLFDVEAVDEARELASSDPAVAAGVFELEVLPFRTSAPLRRLLELERGVTRHLELADPEGPTWAGRPWVLVTADANAVTETRLAALERGGRVPLSGRLGGERGGEHLFVVDATSVDLVRGEADDASGWRVHPWFASATLSELPRLAKRKDGPTFVIDPLPTEGKLSVFRPALAKVTTVFSVPIVATEATGDREVLHAAHVLAQYLDNDEDGVPDDEAVVRALIDVGAFLVMVPSDGDIDRLDLDWDSLHDAGFTMGQDLYGEETLPEGPPHVEAAGRFDATLEEVLHLVSFGYEAAYPDAFSFEGPSDLTRAMDLARGGRFDGPPDRYPDEAWYHYDDPTCDYGCMASEYFYWVLTSLLGGQDFPGRGEEIAIEWELPTRDLVRERDPAAYELFTSGRFRLPTRLPDGGYRR